MPSAFNTRNDRLGHLCFLRDIFLRKFSCSAHFSNLACESKADKFLSIDFFEFVGFEIFAKYIVERMDLYVSLRRGILFFLALVFHSFSIGSIF